MVFIIWRADERYFSGKSYAYRILILTIMTLISIFIFRWSNWSQSLCWQQVLLQTPKPLKVYHWLQINKHHWVNNIINKYLLNQEPDSGMILYIYIHHIVFVCNRVKHKPYKVNVVNINDIGKTKSRICLQLWYWFSCLDDWIRATQSLAMFLI